MKIALCGLTTLHTFGLKALCAKQFPECEVICDERWREADGFIVSATALAAHASFFMPRLSRILLFTSAPAQSRESLPVLSPLADEQAIEESITHLIAMAKAERPAATPHHPVRQPQHSLTPREIDVIKLTVEGQTVKQIAARLSISVNTVLTHRKNITDKLGVHGAPALVYYAMSHNIV